VFFGQTNRSYKLLLIGLIGLLILSNILGLISFLSKSAGFFAFSMVIIHPVCGAFRLFIYEFVTEIIFPVSPCFGLAIMHALSGLLSLLISMFAGDIMRTDPLNESFPSLVYIVAAIICGVSLMYVMKQPYKLNRSDYDHGRRSTMVSNYSSGKKKNKGAAGSNGDEEVVKLDAEFHANAINRLLDSDQSQTSLN
jgi:hypothetical protein